MLWCTEINPAPRRGLVKSVMRHFLYTLVDVTLTFEFWGRETRPLNDASRLPYFRMWGRSKVSYQGYINIGVLEKALSWMQTLPNGIICSTVSSQLLKVTDTETNNWYYNSDDLDTLSAFCDRPRNTCIRKYFSFVVTFLLQQHLLCSQLLRKLTTNCSYVRRLESSHCTVFYRCFERFQIRHWTCFLELLWTTFAFVVTADDELWGINNEAQLFQRYVYWLQRKPVLENLVCKEGTAKPKDSEWVFIWETAEASY